MTDSLALLAREARRYRRKRSAERFFHLLTSRALPGIVALLTLAFLSRFLWPGLIYALLLIPPWILGTAIYLLLRKDRWLVPLWKAGALADLKSRSHGTFMAVEETMDREWPVKLTTRDIRLSVVFPWPGAVKWIVGGLAVAAVLLLPDMSPRSAQAQSVAAPVQKLENMVATLREENLADEAFLDEVEKAMEELEEDVGKSLKAGDWQALDGLREDLERKALDSYRRLRESQSEFQALREAMTVPSATRDDAWQDVVETLAQLNPEDAADFLEKAAEFSTLNSQELKGLLADCRAGRFDFSGKERAFLSDLAMKSWLTPEQMKRLRKALEGLDLSKLEGWCEGMGLEALTPEELERLLRLLEEGKFCFGEGDIDKLKALCMGACAGCKLGAGACAGMLPGRGGINRGPGPATLTGTGDTDRDIGEFAGKSFRGNLADPDVPMGFSYAPPDPDAKPGEGMRDAAGPAMEFKSGNERITWHSRLLPRHNDVMKKYFDDDMKK